MIWRTQFILLLVLALFCEAKLSKKKWDRVENKLNTVLEKMIRKFQEIREGHGKGLILCSKKKILGVESRDFSQADKEITVCKAE